MKTEVVQQAPTKTEKHSFGEPHIATQLFAEMVLVACQRKTSRTSNISANSGLFARFVFSPDLLDASLPPLSRDPARIGYFCFTPENILLVIQVLYAADFSLKALYKSLGFPKEWSAPLTQGIAGESVHPYLLIGNCADLVAISPQVALATSQLLNVQLGIPSVNLGTTVGANKLHRADATVCMLPPRRQVQEHLLYDEKLTHIQPQALCVVELPLKNTSSES